MNVGKPQKVVIAIPDRQPAREPVKEPVPEPVKVGAK
ncbi:hypothetical protein LCGC14_3025590 [marine sediment metagenome]|uniref:Uncharacterized protein n=1 Tax=marine sediment metagenome TaxID=412755 RepID=A0A0F8WTU9_9ZZZZ